jgi:hypothetical protein
MVRWLNVGVSGEAAWPEQETKIVFGGHELVLRPATKDTEQSVHIALKGLSDVEALTLINRFLSILAWCDDQGMENLYGWSGNPIPVSVPRRSRSIGSSIAFPFYRDMENDQKARLVLALYREARTINNIPFEFLSYFKILNMFWKDKSRNHKNELVEGLRNVLPRISNEEALKRIETLSKQHSDVAHYLYQSGRCAVAHAYSDPIVDPDDVSDLRRLSEDMWIIKAVAEFLIENELHLSRSMIG